MGPFKNTCKIGERGVWWTFNTERHNVGGGGQGGLHSDQKY
jgi:hypothetical protein